MQHHIPTTIILLFSLLTFLATTVLAAPIEEFKADIVPRIPIGASHFARSIPDLIAEKKAKEERALAARAKGREMGLW